MREERINIKSEYSAAGLLLFEGIHKFVVCNTVYPRRKTPRGVKTLNVLVCLDEGILHEIRGIFLVKKKFARIPHELGLVALDKFPEEVTVSRLHLACDFFISLLDYHAISKFYISRA